MRVLLLGGTAEARQLAALLLADGVAVTTSLAGAVGRLATPPGEVRVGGFGGADGLADQLRRSGTTAVVDATHPFAARITANAAAACAATGVPLLRLERPSWSERSEAAEWHWVDSLADARDEADRLGGRILLAVGRQSLAEFADGTDRAVVARVIDPPEVAIPASWEVIRARGPFRVADELSLLRDRAIDVLVTKDSGGQVSAKLDAAAQLGVAVVVVRRPPLLTGLEVVRTPAEAAAWVVVHAGSSGPT